MKKPPPTPTSPSRIPNQRTQTKTPTKSPVPSTSSDKDRGRGDGPHADSPPSPAKRLKRGDGDCLETVEGETEAPPRLRYAALEGCVEFRRPSLKKLQPETRWRRPCKLGVAYTTTGRHDPTVHLVIYEGNVKCRRNLLREFEAGPPEK